MRLLWEDRAWEDYLYWQTQDKKVLKRINLLIKDISRSPFDGIGKPEPLKNTLADGGAEELMKPIGLCTMSKMGLFMSCPVVVIMIELENSCGDTSGSH